MIQSIIIFAVILILKAVLTAVAKQQETKKKEELAKRSATKTATPIAHVSLRQPPVIQPWVDARAARAKAVALDSSSADDLKSDARRRAHLHGRPPIKAAPLHESEGESTFEQLARTVAAIHGGVLSVGVGETPLPIAAPAVVARPHAVPSKKVPTAVRRSRFQARKAMIAFEIFSPPLSMR